MIKQIKKFPWVLVGIIHFIVSFFYETILFTNEELTGFYKITLTHKEILLTHILATILSFFIILFFWKLFFFVIFKFRDSDKKWFIYPFILVFLKYFITAILIFPNMWGWDTDSYVDFSMAIRYIPDYWQNYFTNVVYGACFRLFPHPLSFSFVQVTGFSGVIAYVFYHLRKFVNGRSKAPYLIFLIILIPSSLRIALYPYRNSLYTILYTWVVSFLLFEYLEKKEWNYKKIIFLLISTSILAGWRSEGIFSLILIPILCYIVYKGTMNRKKIILFTASCFVGFFLFSMPQNYGMNSYFGKDYIIIALTNDTLNKILNSEDVDLTYENANVDLENIDKVIGLDYIKQIGVGSYQVYNESQGRMLSQTLASEEDQKNFIKSAVNIILHNPVLYIRERLYCFFYALGVAWPDGVSSNIDMGIDRSNALSEYLKSAAFGEEELLNTTFDNSIYLKLQNVFVNFSDWIKPYYGSLVNPMVVTLRLALIITLVISFIIHFIKKNWFWVCLFLLIGLQLGIVFLMEPEPRETYFYPMFYCGIIISIVYCTCLKKITIREKLD